MIRLLLDQGLATEAASLLRADGIDVVNVKELGMSRAADVDILEYARQDGRACVTFDTDFHSHLATSRASAFAPASPTIDFSPSDITSRDRR